MSSATSRLRVQENNGIVTIGFIDRNILDEANIQKIGDEISRIVEEQPTPRLLINFENVDHLSSAALGTLITINNKVRNKEGQLRLAGIDPQIYEIFKITNLVKLFKVHDTPEDAMKSFT